MNQRCQKLSVHKNFSLGRLKFNSYLWQLPAVPTSSNVMIFFFIFKLPGKVTRQTYFKLITYRFSHGPTWTSQSSPTRAWNANQGAWVLCILMMEQSLFVTLNGGWGGGVLDVGSGHKWQALSKGGRRHEKKKKKKEKYLKRLDHLITVLIILYFQLSFLVQTTTTEVRNIPYINKSLLWRLRPPTRL